MPEGQPQMALGSLAPSQAFFQAAAGIWFTKAGTMRHFSVMAVPRQKTLLGGAHVPGGVWTLVTSDSDVARC